MGPLCGTGQEIYSVDIPKKDVKHILEGLVPHKNLSIVLFGKKGAYVLESVSVVLDVNKRLSS